MLRKKSPIAAIVFGLLTFVLAKFISTGILHLLPNTIIWAEQVLMKAVLILLSIAAIKYLLKIPVTEAGFKRPASKLKKGKIIFSGMAIGALATVLIFFTPAAGIALVNQLNALEFLLIVVIWSSIAEEIFIRGFIQSYLKPFEKEKVRFFNLQFSIPVITSAIVFSAIHLSLLFTGTDYFTVLFTVFTTFLLGLLAGVYREKYDSITPSIITHMSFNIGGILTGIFIAILYKIITGEFPHH